MKQVLRTIWIHCFLGSASLSDLRCSLRPRFTEVCDARHDPHESFSGSALPTEICWIVWTKFENNTSLAASGGIAHVLMPWLNCVVLANSTDALYGYEVHISWCTRISSTKACFGGRSNQEITGAIWAIFFEDVFTCQYALCHASRSLKKRLQTILTKW